MNVPATLAILCACLLGIGLLIPKRTRSLGLPLFAAGLVLLSYFWWQNLHYDNAFDRLPDRASRADIVAGMGAPDRVTDGSISIYGNAKAASELISGCTEELWYVSLLSPEQYAFCLDPSGHLVRKYHYTSY
jgi:hypothetical protein